jgi:hypothetical protein
MVKIIIPNDNLPERKYIIEVLLGEFIGVDFEIQADAGKSNYEICLENHNRIIIEDHFFSKHNIDLTYLDENNLPAEIQFLQNKFAPENDIPVLYGSSLFEIKEEISGKKEIICGIDVFASSFFMLTRWEEYVCKKKDKLERFSGRSSISFNSNFLHRPVVNEYATLLRHMLTFSGYDAPETQRRFTPYITHDVDLPLKWYSLSRFIRVLAGDLFKRKDLKLFFSNIVDYIMTLLRKKEDPYDTFDLLMSLSEKINTRSLFFFISEDKLTKQTVKYKLTDPFIKELMHSINNRGHYIGFHPDISTYNNPEAWMRELNHLKTQSPQNILFGRQHFLQIEVPITWQIWNDAGMLWDSSLTYNDEPGFRTGSCYPYSVFNFLTRRKLKLKERPLIIMDVALVLAHKDMSADQMIEKSKALIDQTRKYNGDFVLLWHNHCLNVVEWKDYIRVYTSIIDYLKPDNR